MLKLERERVPVLAMSTYIPTTDTSA